MRSETRCTRLRTAGALAVVAMAVTALGCQDAASPDATPPATGSLISPVPVLKPLTGTLVVMTATTGAANAVDGFTVTIDSIVRSIAPIDTLVVSGLPPGDSIPVELGDVPPNCTVSSDVTVSVTIPPGGAAAVAFQVTCTGGVVDSSGTLSITTATTGEGQPAGYTLSITGPGGTFSDTIGANSTKTFPEAAPGDYNVELKGVPTNCTLDTTEAPNPRTVRVPPGGTGSTTFDVACTAVPPPPPPPPQTGTVSITTVTTGDSMPTRYTVIVRSSTGDSLNGSIGANQTKTASVPAGDYTVELRDVPNNCTLDTAAAPNPRPVNVPAGDTGSTTFSVNCTATTATGAEAGSDGFAITVPVAPYRANPHSHMAG